MLVLHKGSSAARITCPHRGASVPAGNVTITVLDDGATELLAATNCTKGSFSSTLSASASQGATSITVASVTGLAVNEPIVLTDTSGRSEVAIAKGVNSSSKVVSLQDRLSRTYASSDTAKSAFIYYDLNISSTSTFPAGTYYQAIFQCSTWSQPRILIFRIVDIPTENPITYDDVRRWIDNVSVIRDQYDEADLDAPRTNAWNMIKAILKRGGRDPDVWRDSDEAQTVGGLLAASLFLLGHGHYDEARQMAGDPIGSGGVFALYWSALEKSPVWFDQDQDRARDDDETLSAGNYLLRRGL